MIFRQTTLKDESVLCNWIEADPYHRENGFAAFWIEPGAFAVPGGNSSSPIISWFIS